MSKEVDFRCCQDPECDLIGRRLITDFSEILNRSNSQKEISALILTGSFARGEGSILKLDNQGYRVMGDIEFFAVIEKKEKLDIVRNSISVAVETFEEILKKNDALCKIEVTPTFPKFFRKLRPRIFEYELFSNGKTIWGDEAYLEKLPRFSPKELSKIDAIYLLFNRLIEQLELLLKIKDGAEIDLIDATYQMAKIYIDVVTSTLAYTGNFENTYFKRANRFNELIAAKAFGNGEWLSENISEEVSYWTDVKLRPRLENFVPGGIIDQTKLLAKWAQLAEMVKNVLRWEICNYLDLDQSTDLRKVLWSFSKSFTLTHRIKEWIKFHINARVPPHEKSILRTLQLLKNGSPRTLIYFCAALLYFDLAAEIGKGMDIGNWKDNVPLGIFIPAGFRKQEASPFDLIHELLRNWELYLRNN